MSQSDERNGGYRLLYSPNNKKLVYKKALTFITHSDKHLSYQEDKHLSKQLDNHLDLDKSLDEHFDENKNEHLD